MTEQGHWTLAPLDPEQLVMLDMAENTLDAGVLLAYHQTDGATAFQPTRKLTPATLNESQLECLQGLEQQVGAVVVAYAEAK